MDHFLSLAFIPPMGIAAFSAGFLSFISPCVLPLVPAYLCYLTGASLDQLTGGKSAPMLGNNRKSDKNPAILRNALCFVLGFSTIFILLGLGASSIGQLLREHMRILSLIAGIIIIVMGVHFLGLFKIAILYREIRFRGNLPFSGAVGAYLMGLAFAFGWTPCIGPILGPILALAGTKKTIVEGGVLLAVYGAGLGIPFLLAAVFLRQFMYLFNYFRHYLGLVEKTMGALLVIVGIVFLSGGMQTMGFWLLEYYPILGTIG